MSSGVVADSRARTEARLRLFETMAAFPDSPYVVAAHRFGPERMVDFELIINAEWEVNHLDKRRWQGEAEMKAKIDAARLAMKELSAALQWVRWRDHE